MGDLPVVDQYQRPLRDLRVSVTDRCNFRCRYCMPRELFGPDHAFLDREELLTFEEITRVVRIAAGLGARKIRLTGGEPLVRRDLPTLVAMLTEVDGIEDIGLTTNGSLLRAQAPALYEAGLRRLTISLDSIDENVFTAMADTPIPLRQVLDGIAAAAEAGFDPIKVNAVVKRGVNDDGIVDLARFGREHGVIVRFIEYMDVGTTNGWRLDEVVPSRQVVELIHEAFPIEPVDPAYTGEVADRWRYLDGGGEVGVISSVTEPFCATCTRARLSAVGEVYTCLFGAQGYDLRSLLRGGASDEELADALAGLWRVRTDRYSELRTEETAQQQKVEMSYIGG
ncbi:GTP 3',8-cyclase MoaA [Egibacter rhizosphaerae]|uniref:GTP 3',8-cyclase n=1 Tax=Egibacter rhizosphaerae TaxID=1670831 RepID=A0A411YKR3_9ACTN|nr:GTP 3',8-cyclase MoaA [Egibacter rhizosphaerae]QBI21782.1 GTP 3',8-cyclase MoaA [Egibacter rhizosphaerae]